MATIQLPRESEGRTTPTGSTRSGRGIRSSGGSQDGIVVRSRAARASLAALRVLVAWTFIWPFLDKLFGFGFATESKGAVINGGSPTEGFLLHGTQGPFAHVFDGVAGAPWLDALFMAGLLGIGVAFLLGIGTRIAALSCTFMMAFMYLVTLMPATNPLTDEHWLIAIAGIVVATTRAGDYFGLGRRWQNLSLVRRHCWLV